MRTLLICALAITLVGCSSQQSTQPSCVGLNPFACLTAVHVPIEPESHGAIPPQRKPVSLVAWRGQPAPISRGPRRPSNTQADQGRGESRTCRSHTDSFSASEPADDGQCRCFRSASRFRSDARARAATDPHSTTDVPQARTTQEQVAAASAVAERMSVPTLDASLDALVAILVAGPDVKSVSDLAGKTIAIDDRYSESVDQPRQDRDGGGRRARSPVEQRSNHCDQSAGRQRSYRPRSSGWSLPAPRIAFLSSRDSGPFEVPLSARSSPTKP